MEGLNWVDYLIIAVLIFYAYEGYARGFVGAFWDLINFILSFSLGLKFYGILGGFLLNNFSIPKGFSDAIGFFVITFLAEIILGMIMGHFFASSKKFNKLFGILPGILSGAILVSFILILVAALPVSTLIKRSVSESKIGSFLLSSSQGLEKDLNKVFGGAINETINFLTVAPKSSESVSLNFSTSDIAEDPVSEQEMFNLVNHERSMRGLKELVFDNALRDVGRNHCKDMFLRGYFSHYAPEGLSPFDRMDKAGIVYGFAGENLALSPNVDLAMQGLMESPGHKANILSADFGKVGIGVIDGGIYGQTFCQEFSD